MVRKCWLHLCRMLSSRIFDLILNLRLLLLKIMYLVKLHKTSKLFQPPLAIDPLEFQDSPPPEIDTFGVEDVETIT